MSSPSTENEEIEYADYITKDFVMGQFDEKSHPKMVEIDQKYADRSGRIMHVDAYKAFQEMWKAANDQGVNLRILSAARNFDYQKGIWERKWNGSTILSDGVNAAQISDPIDRAKKILLYSSMPGTSRHHWGTDIDLNNFNNEYFSSGEGLKTYTWLNTNAHQFGFCQPYTNKKDGRTGYEEEKWHWTYLPTAKLLTQFYKSNVGNNEIGGFLGDSIVAKVDMLNNYVLGIDPKCL